MKDIVIHWMRRDMRLHDNRTLLAALDSGLPVLVAFLFDQEILDRLDNAQDRRVTFIHREALKLKAELQEAGGDLLMDHGNPTTVWANWIKQLSENGLNVREVHVGRDYEPYAQERDRKLSNWFDQQGIAFKGTKDSVVFEKNEVTKDDGKPYTVFTPYSKKWRKALQPSDYAPANSAERLSQQSLVGMDELVHQQVPTLEEMGFENVWKEGALVPPTIVEDQLLKSYGDQRDFPSVAGTSRLSVHLRFGTVSIREALRQGLATSEKWTTELIWRDFYQTIVYQFPHSATDSFRPAYDAIPWLNDEEQFEAWCQGKTGYPLVDAGMRELAQTGFMHNRVRMVVASFLCKHLLIDWRWGERFFARHLLDFDLASNAGGWQWAAGSGCDAAPYFRVFNPTSQLQKFDKDLIYVRKWVPEYGTSLYPEPIVDHAMARVRAIETYRSVLKPNP
ncbi:MAG: deoxyribodipyrimidine photo-lyase [Flavobacteriales bacterium]|nr:deoxyribodipyrimidine photo-lyase [Flavobacteriales bacterium]